MAKRFDQIHYKFVTKAEAKDILIDNLYALLRFKYFKKINEQIDQHIKRIVDNFAGNIQTTLQRISFTQDDGCEIKKMLPDNCVAFRNGVYDFKANEWLFKYDIYELDFQRNRIYQYDYAYIITWYINIDFEPKHHSESIDDMITEMQKSPSCVFMLAYNMSFSKAHAFSKSRFIHLLEIMGYTLLQSFSQKFVFLVGEGSNGKNSLMDGCLVDRIIPKPATYDLHEIEKDKYITSSLINRHLNVKLESSNNPFRESRNIKTLTGSIYQTITPAKQTAYDGMINCRFVFSANNQYRIKFADTSHAFQRRVNLMEIYYTWDKAGRYLELGDYYRLDFSNSLQELKTKDNVMDFIYLAIQGIKHATCDFTQTFEFSYNDWSVNYLTSTQATIQDINTITLKEIAQYLKFNPLQDKPKDAFLNLNHERLYLTREYKRKGIDTIEKLIQETGKENSMLNGNYYYVPIWLIKALRFSQARRITDMIRMQMPQADIREIRHNSNYIRVKIENDTLKVE